MTIVHPAGFAFRETCNPASCETKPTWAGGRRLRI